MKKGQEQRGGRTTKRDKRQKKKLRTRRKSYHQQNLNSQNTDLPLNKSLGTAES